MVDEILTKSLQILWELNKIMYA